MKATGKQIELVVAPQIAEACHQGRSRSCEQSPGHRRYCRPRRPHPHFPGLQHHPPRLLPLPPLHFPQCHPLLGRRQTVLRF